MTDENTPDQTHPNPERWWRHRRWMAWLGLGFSLISWLVGITASIMMPNVAAEAIHPLATGGLWAGLIPMGSYVGNCAVSEVWGPSSVNT